MIISHDLNVDRFLCNLPDVAGPKMGADDGESSAENAVNPADTSLTTRKILVTEELSQNNQISKYSAFTTSQKRGIVAGAALGAIFSPLAVQIYLPALEALAKDLDISVSKANLTVTIYLVFQGVTPVFIAGFSDYLGRRPAYLLCFVIFIAANIGLALSGNYGTLLAFRMIQVSCRSRSRCLATTWILLTERRLVALHLRKLYAKLW